MNKKETLVNFYSITRRHLREHSILHVDPSPFSSAPSDKRGAKHIDPSFFGCLKPVSSAVSSQKESR
jgi:hypothetical protein